MKKHTVPMMDSVDSVPAVSRRHFLLGVSAVAATAAAADKVVLAAGAEARIALPQWLELFNTHTAETLRVAFRNAVGFVAPSLDKLSWLLRDHRAGESAPIDPGLFDQLAALATAAGVEPRYEVISGYRSPHTNAALRAAGRGVASRSLHMQGRAIDVRLRGVSCARLRDLAIDAARGGVGYYRRSDFVHLDTGRVRAWTG